MALLKEGDGNEFSKKEDSIRRKELLASIQDRLYKFLNENLNAILKADPKSTIFIRAALNSNIVNLENVQPLMEQLADIASASFKIGGDNLVESPSGHMLLRKIILHDKIRIAGNQPTFSGLLLSQLIKKMTFEDYLKCNRGAFALVTMIETDVPELKKTIKENVKLHKKTFKVQTTRGAEILKQKLENVE